MIVRSLLGNVRSRLEISRPIVILARFHRVRQGFACGYGVELRGTASSSYPIPGDGVVVELSGVLRALPDEVVSFGHTCPPRWPSPGFDADSPPLLAEFDERDPGLALEWLILEARSEHGQKTSGRSSR